MAESNDSKNMHERGSQPVTLLMPLSGTCYTRGARAVAERNAFLGTAPAAVHFPRNFSRVAGRRARHSFLHALAMASAGSRPSQPRREVWPDMAGPIATILVLNFTTKR